MKIDLSILTDLNEKAIFKFNSEEDLQIVKSFFLNLKNVQDNLIISESDVIVSNDQIQISESLVKQIQDDNFLLKALCATKKINTVEEEITSVKERRGRAIKIAEAKLIHKHRQQLSPSIQKCIANNTQVIFEELNLPKQTFIIQQPDLIESSIEIKSDDLVFSFREKDSAKQFTTKNKLESEPKELQSQLSESSEKYITCYGVIINYKQLNDLLSKTRTIDLILLTQKLKQYNNPLSQYNQKVSAFRQHIESLDLNHKKMNTIEKLVLVSKYFTPPENILLEPLELSMMTIISDPHSRFDFIIPLLKSLSFTTDEERMRALATIFSVLNVKDTDDALIQVLKDKIAAKMSKEAFDSSLIPVEKKELYKKVCYPYISYDEILKDCFSKFYLSTPSNSSSDNQGQEQFLKEMADYAKQAPETLLIDLVEKYPTKDYPEHEVQIDFLVNHLKQNVTFLKEHLPNNPQFIAYFDNKDIFEVIEKDKRYISHLKKGCDWKFNKIVLQNFKRDTPIPEILDVFFTDPIGTMGSDFWQHHKAYRVYFEQNPSLIESLLTWEGDKDTFLGENRFKKQFVNVGFYDYVTQDPSITQLLSSSKTDAWIQFFLKANPMTLEYMGSGEKANQVYVKMAVGLNPETLQFADSRLLQDVDFMLKLIKANEGILYKYLTLVNNKPPKDFILEFHKSNPELATKYLSEHLREIVEKKQFDKKADAYNRFFKPSGLKPLTDAIDRILNKLSNK